MRPQARFAINLTENGRNSGIPSCPDAGKEGYVAKKRSSQRLGNTHAAAMVEDILAMTAMGADK